MMFRLGTGGANPDPFNNYSFKDDPSAEYARSEPPSTLTSPLNPNPFEGGDKNISTLNEWMSVVMTRIKELSGDTYWYSEEGLGGTAPNISDTWHDTLGSSLMSKGEFSHDELIGGQVTWNENIRYNNLTDPRSIIIRPSTINLTDESIAYIELIRDAELNTTSTPAIWLTGSSIVSGVVGSFENLTKGDWIKKKSDDHPLYLRAEEFYAGTTGPGSGLTSPALAKSVKLSANYAGTSSTEIGDYTKGEYLQTDIVIADRDDPATHEIGGNFYWLSYRSDVLLGLESITPTQLVIDITQADGVKARVTSVGHGLIDLDRITITSGGYADTYQVEVEDDDNFFINTSTTGDEPGQNAFYAIVESRAVETDYGFQLESANHTARANQRVFIENTASLYDGSYLVNPRSDTTFQIAYDALTPDPSDPVTGNVRVIKVNVKTEFGVVKIIQGESIDIGDADTQNILTYVGMESLAQTVPVYSTPDGYNALDGHHNYNSDINDNLTTRASKLTSMMADRVQERGFSLRGRVNVTSVTNGLNQDISANGTLTLHKPSSPEQVIDLTVSLPANSVAIANIDRDGNSAISLTVDSIGNNSLLSENKIIMFYRFGDTTVHTWEDNTIVPSGHLNLGLPEDSSNRNIIVYNPGQIKLDPLTGVLDLVVRESKETTLITALSGAVTPQSSWFTFNAALDATEYYVWYDINAGGTDPAIVGKTAIPVAILPGDSADDVALATETAIATIAVADVTASLIGSEVTITNLLIGDATKAADGGSTGFSISILCSGNDPDIELIIPGSSNNIVDVDVINGLGTLVIPDGSAAWVRVNRYAVKTFNTILTTDVPDTDVNGAIYVTSIQDVPVDQDVFVIWTRIQDSMVESNKAQHPDGNVYEEYLDVVSSPAANLYEITGPIPSGTELQLPPDSRDDGRIQEYVIGAGQLKIFLRGQFLRNGVDWEEIGEPGCLSSKIKILQKLEISDSLFWRIDSLGAVYFASDGVMPSLQDSYDGGRFINIVTGQPIVITGASGKLMSIQGDLDVTGVIDPKGITFDLQASTPFISQSGIWFNTFDEMVIETIAANSALTTKAGNLILKSATNKVQTAAVLELGDYLDMNSHLLTDLTGPVTLGVDLSLNDNLLLGGTGDLLLGDNIDVNGNHLVDGGTLLLHISGTNSVYAGLGAGNLTATGSSNTGIGDLALQVIAAGNNNTATGGSALQELISGSSNTALGQGSLVAETSGSSNTAVGYSALATQDGSSDNTALGDLAGNSISSGSNSLFLGSGSDTSSPLLDNQIAIGYNAIVDAANKMRIGNDSLTTVEFAPGTTLQAPSGNLSIDTPSTLALSSDINITITSLLVSLVGAAETSSTLSVGGVLSMNNNLISNVATPVAATDAARKKEVDDLESLIDTGFIRADGTNAMAATLDMDSNIISNVTTPVATSDAATKGYVDGLETTINSEFLRLDGTKTMAAIFNMGTNRIINVVNPTNTQDAATKSYVDVRTSSYLTNIYAADKTLIYDNDQVALVSGTTTITLPTALFNGGRFFIIKKTDVIGTNIIIDCFGSETIDGAVTQTLTQQNESIMVISDDVNWNII